jgi:NAD(P)-dependent dehydrogenase (short-subunit alcohol dehydrogenase family)
MNSNDMCQEIDLGGQVAVVTGAGRGIGRAMAQELAKAGAAVAVVARSEDQLTETVALIEGAGGRAIALPEDVTDQQAVERAMAETEQQLGPVDLLVCNAGHGGQVGPLWEVEPDEWWRCVEVNLRGPFLCARAVVPGMIARQRGRIIVTSSMASVGPWPYMSAYAISKAAVTRLSESLAEETKAHGICVFALHPGSVRTAMWESLFLSDVAEKHLPDMYDYVSQGGSGVPPKRAAELALFLASGQADALSGCFISVDDDVTVMVQRAEEIQRDELHTLRLRT